MSHIGIIVNNIRKKNTFRPPKWSVNIPMGNRKSEPVKIGIATKRPNWVSFNPSSSLIGMPMTANIIQTIKQTVNENVLEPKIQIGLLFSDIINTLF